MLQSHNLLNIARNGAITGMFALAATVVLLVGEIDLSLGATMVLALILGGMLNDVTNDVVMIIASLLAGLALGFVNGFLVAKFRIKSLMVTLGAMSLYTGLAYVISRGRVVLLWNAPNYRWMGRELLLGMPVPVVFFLAILIIMYILLTKTKFGKEAYYTGANPLAAWMSGVNIRRIKLVMFMLSGLCATLGGLFQAALLSEVGPFYGGAGHEMTGLSIAIFGGASLSGGKGSVLCTAVAALTFSLLLNVLILSGLGTYMEMVFKGFFLIVIVIVFQYLETKRYSRI